MVEGWLNESAATGISYCLATCKTFKITIAMMWRRLVRKRSTTITVGQISRAFATGLEQGNRVPRCQWLNLNIFLIIPV